MSRQARATTGFLPTNASMVTVKTTSSEPREPYFALRPDQSHHASVHQSHSQGAAPVGRQAPPNTIPRKHLALIGGLVDIDDGFASNLNLSITPTPILSSSSSGANLKSPLTAFPPSRTGDTNVEESISITVATMPSRRKPEIASTNRREGPTIHVYQEPNRIFQSKENIPIHISPKKRKADSSDSQPRTKAPPIEHRGEGRSTLSETERQIKSQNSNQQADINGSAPLLKSSKYQSHIPNDEQPASRFRSFKKAQASNTVASTIEAVHAKAKGQLENHTRVEIEILDDDDDSEETAVHVPQRLQQPQQPKPQAIASKGEQEDTIDAAPSTVGKDVLVVDEAVLVATQDTAEERSKGKVHVFDSEAFDTMIYRQSMLRPPQGVSLQAPARPKTPVQKPFVEHQRRYLPVDPAIHLPYNRSEEWYKQKALEIQARGGRKAWFGKVIERRRWLRAKEKAEEDERNMAKASNQKPLRMDPQPWSYNRVLDFGDVPPEELPEDVLQDPAWIKACAWHRENHAKRILRDRAAKDATRKAWDQAERIMEDAKIALQRSREP
ncbi:hypothetical protein ACHAQJ_005065 [Trichoderma viride]